MKTKKHIKRISLFIALFVLAVTSAEAQRYGGMESGSIEKSLLLSNGPKGPIHGGESAITDMIFMPDGLVYGSTEAIRGAQACHIFHSCGDHTAHEVNVTEKLPGQVKVLDIAQGYGNSLVGGTTTYNEIFDDPDSDYEGGHLFSFDTETKTFNDLGIISPGQGIHCVAVDTVHTRIYCVTYPEGHLYAYNYETEQKKDFGEVMKPWRIKDLGRVSWRGVPKVLMIDDAGTVYFSTYMDNNGGCIFRLTYGDEAPIFTGAVVPTQRGMHNDPIYENTILSAIQARDGGFWCGTSVDGFLFKFYPSTSTVVNKGKAFNYWNLRSLAYGGDGRLYMLGGRDYDNPWLMCYDPGTGSMESLGWPSNYSQCGAICADAKGRILMGENMRNSYIWVYRKSAVGLVENE